MIYKVVFITLTVLCCKEKWKWITLTVLCCKEKWKWITLTALCCKEKWKWITLTNKSKNEYYIKNLDLEAANGGVLQEKLF